MPGTFIISLDCEGNWGVPQGGSRMNGRLLTTSALIRAYESLVNMLARHEVSATFAFVMAFTLATTEAEEWMPRLTTRKFRMENFDRAEDMQDFDGWFCSEVFELVRDSRRHEIACHGFRHASIGRNGMMIDDAAYEVRSATELAKIKGVTPKTFVFPKNDVGNLNLLAQEGYIGFRNANPIEGRYGRLGNLAREFNIWELAQNCEPSLFGLVSIPGGYFFNWRYGLRRVVPETLTLLRWRSILTDATVNNRVASLWLHPENLIAAPETLQSVEKIIRIAAELRERSGLSIVTQAEYCLRQRV